MLFFIVIAFFQDSYCTAGGLGTNVDTDEKIGMGSSEALLWMNILGL